MTSPSTPELAYAESPAPLMVTSNRRVKDCNKAFAALFGYAKHELLGELVAKIYPTTVDFERIGARCFDWLKTHNSYEDERFMQHKNREIFWARARGVTLTPLTPFELVVWNFERLNGTETRSADLTPREREISSYIVNGMTAKETAAALKISPRTVELHRARILKKLGAKNSVDLVSRIIEVRRRQPGATGV